MVENIQISEVSDEVLNKMASRIKVVMRLGREKHNLKQVDIHEEFFYDPIPAKIAEEPELRVLEDVTVYLPIFTEFGFEPRLADIFAQIPERLRDQVDAIEIIKYPGNQIEVRENWEEYREGYLVMTVRLYSRMGTTAWKYLDNNNEHSKDYLEGVQLEVGQDGDIELTFRFKKAKIFKAKLSWREIVTIINLPNEVYIKPSDPNLDLVFTFFHNRLLSFFFKSPVGETSKDRVCTVDSEEFIKATYSLST